MALARIGALANFSSATQTSSSSVTVGAGATLFVVCTSGYLASANAMSGTTPTLNGVACTGKLSIDSDTGAFMGAMFYWVNPATGSQTLAWSWAIAINNGVLFVVGSYSGVDTASPVRSSSGVQAPAGGTISTASLTAQTADLVVAWSSRFSGGGAGSWTWTNATVVTSFVGTDTHTIGSFAEASPSGNVVVSIAESNSNGDGGIGAFVFKPQVVIRHSGVPPIQAVKRAAYY